MAAYAFSDAASLALNKTRVISPTGHAGPRPERRSFRVQPHSREEGTFEEEFFAPPAPGETDNILRAARRALDSARRLKREVRTTGRKLTRSERLVASLTSTAVRVLEEILTLARLNRGRVFPSYEHLAAATALGRATIGRALPVLESIGFLVRQRRFKRIVSNKPGPRYEQTSNAYRATLSPMIAAFLPRWMRPAPIPDDIVQESARREDEHAIMLNESPCQGFAMGEISATLGEALARLEASIDLRERESQFDARPLLDTLYSDEQNEP